MKRYILHISTFVVFLFVATSVWGQLGTSGNWTSTTVSTNQTITLTGPVSIKGTITINSGITLTIDGKNNTITPYTSTDNTKSGPTSFIVYGKLNINDVTIDGGNAGVIFAENKKGEEAAMDAYNLKTFTKAGTTIDVRDLGKVNLTNVTAKNLYANSNGGVAFIHIYDDPDTGENTNKTNRMEVTLKNCTVTNCLHHNDNGIIYQSGGVKTHGTITIDNTDISHCMIMANKTGTGHGGVIKGPDKTDCNLVMKNNSSMSYCWSSGWGGAILWAANSDGCSAQFNNCTFKNNYARYLGGAISSEATIKVENCTFENNTAGGGGGAIAAFPFTLDDDSNLTTTSTAVGLELGANNMFKDNKTSFKNNINGSNVNNIFNKYSGTDIIVPDENSFNPKYSLTSAKNMTYPTGGGAIWILMNKDKWNCSVSIDEGNEINNNYSANEGGGILLFKMKPENMEDYTVVNGKKTGVTILNLSADIKDNKAEYSGGGVSISSSKSTYSGWEFPLTYINGGTISSNTTNKGNGGGIYMPGGSIEVKANPNFADNIATEGDGGAIYLGGGTFVIHSGAKVTLGSQTAPNQALNGKGGAIYCAAPFTTDGEIIMQSNKAEEGGAIYVENGSLTANGNTAKITASGNSATNGGVFCVNGGNVTLNSAIMQTNHATNNGGAIALYNGTFSMTDNSSINNNTATNFGGGLYVYSEKNNTQGINCTGGSFISNSAKAGGAVFADGDFPMTLAANMENNKAGIGGAIYMANGVDMTFGAGIIRLNVAEGTTTASTAFQKTHTDVSGVGGGIFMANNTTLQFSVPSQLGIYDNAATNAGADICANGSNTTVTLAAIDETNLAGKEGPANDWYWVYDYFNSDTNQGLLDTGLTPMRYEKLLMTPSEEEDLVLKYIVPDNKTAQKDLTGYVCLDLGYDLVFVHFKTEGLMAQDNTAILMSFSKEDGSYELYRRVLFNGSQEKIVALPSSTWKFEASNWGIHYNTPVFSANNGTIQNGVTNVNNKNKNFIITFTENDSPAKKKSLIHEHYKINRMDPNRKKTE